MTSRRTETAAAIRVAGQAVDQGVGPAGGPTAAVAELEEAEASLAGAEAATQGVAVGEAGCSRLEP